MSQQKHKNQNKPENNHHQNGHHQKSHLKKEEKTLQSKGFFMSLIESKTKVFFLITLIAFLFYGNSIPNKYSLDDIYVANNQQVKKGFKALPEIITGLYASHEMQQGQTVSFGYRPVVKATFAIEYGLFGQNPHISHFINILLYIITIWLIYRLFQILFGHLHPLFPLIACLLFLAHPTHTEVVTSLKNRDELLSFLLSLVTLNLMRKWSVKGNLLNFAGGFLVFIIALLSKISALAFVAIIPLVLWFIPGVNRKKLIYIVVALAVAFLMVKFLPKLYLPHRIRPKLLVENPMIYMSFFERIPTAFYILLFYLKLIFLPFPLRFYYGYGMIPVVNWGHPLVWLSVIIHIGLIYLAMVNFKKRSWISIGIFIYLFAISMYTNLVQIVMGIVADRFLYSPSLGFSIVLTGLIFIIARTLPEKLSLQKNAALRIFAVSFLLIGAGMVKTIARNNDWKSVDTLIKHDIVHLENSARANFMYGDLMIKEVMRAYQQGKMTQAREMLQDGIAHLEHAIDIFPDYFLAYNLLGQAYYKFYLDIEKAKKYFLKSIEIEPNFADAYSNYAFMCFKEKNFAEAEKYYLTAIKLLPHNKTYMQDLANVYRESGETEKLEALLKKMSETRGKSGSNQGLLPF
ncbi:MAG: tetratricopeptide repeat protein [Sphingobacteriales bacterium]|nr:tetratricopeptide repeat protein [Sphingobacteriales bacterium]